MTIEDVHRTKPDNAIEELQAENERLRGALGAACNALRSYQYGNQSPDLAKSVAQAIDLLLENEEDELGCGTSPLEKVYQRLSPSERKRLIEGEWK